MSLINDALKKAQKQRTGESPPLGSMPGVGGESAAKIAKRARPVSFNSMLVRLGLAGGAVLMLAVAGIFLARALRDRPEPAPAPASVPAVKPAPVTPATAPATPAAEPTPTKFVLPIAPPATPAPAPSAPPTPAAPAVVATTAPAGTPAPAPVTREPAPKPETKPVAVAPVVTPTPAPTPAPAVVAAPPPPPKPVEPPPRLDNKAVNYIESLRIAGIRASATDSKVLMNDRVYRVGDIVEHDMGLKLVGITSSSLTFENDRGASYTRNF